MAECFPSKARSKRLAAACVFALGVGACTGVRQHPDGGDTGAAGSTLTGVAGASGGAGIGAPFDAGPNDLFAVGGLPDVTPIERMVGGGPPLGDAACAAQTQKAQQVPLDLYIMLDDSLSMSDPLSTRQTKWVGVRNALTTFLGDPNSAGIGVGLQYFPLQKPGVPASCTTDAMCGTNGPCANKLCTGFSDPVFCLTDADCGGGAGNVCRPAGTCSLTPNFFCIPSVDGMFCGDPMRGTPRGNTCAVNTAVCAAPDYCDNAVYAMPAVEVMPLPAAATPLVASLNAHMPVGVTTPTFSALSGAVAHAQLLAQNNPGHQEAVVLVTDGLPTGCMPRDIPSIAAAAAKGLAGPRPVLTFLIGVFAPTEAAAGTTNLNTIAAAGGTKQAFVISTQSQNVEQQFVAALNSVRTAALSCEYKVPMAAAGETLDFYSVNVQYTSGAGQAVTIGNVSSKAACDARKGGWYYDVDPANGGKPSTISICDTSCTQLRADAAGRVDVLLGCKTEIVVP